MRTHLPNLLTGCAAGALLAALVLSACGASDGSPATDGNDDGPWSYKSASGETVTVDHRPTRIVAHSDEAAALMSYGIRPVGIYGNEKPTDNRNLEDYDLSGIAVLGTEWGEVDVEKAASLDPDLIVADWWPAEKAYSGLEDGVKAKSKKLGELAPVIGGAQGSSLVDTIAYYEGLAEALGADVADSDGAKEKAAFDAAVAKFKEATAAKPGLTAMGMAPGKDLLYVANPAYAPELLDFRKWGLDVHSPRDPDPDFPYWENLSWEKADKYQPDLVLQDDRMVTADQEMVDKQPTWKSIRAVQAGAVVPWPGYWIHTYEAYAEQLDQLAGEIEDARTDIGS
jgi:iron complex transport system substrate-binding protein